VHNLGRPPRRLVLLHLDGVSEELPEPGTPVLLGTREVGRVGTVVRHHELGVVALALVKQSVAADAALTVGGSRAAIDPDDVPAALDEEQVAARQRVQAVRSGTMLR
jgi:folate-binding Fe-S cluster repair protein YgfZ